MKNSKIKEFVKKIVKVFSNLDMYEMEMMGECRLVCHPAHLNLEQPYFWF